METADGYHDTSSFEYRLPTYTIYLPASLIVQRCSQLVHIRAKVPVSDVMIKIIITLTETSTAKEAALAMSSNNIGSVVISRDNHPIGIITEKDLVERVMAKGLNPDTTVARSIMSSPLSVIGPNVDIMEAARRMAKLGIRRLIVMNRGDMVGIITARDILNTAPELVEVLTEARRNGLLYRETMAGYCDRCEEWSDKLKDVDGQFICEECRGE